MKSRNRRSNLAQHMCNKLSELLAFKPLQSIIHLVCVLSICLGSTGVWSQQMENELWYSFTDESKELIGFRNENNEIRIPPTFPTYAVSAKKFEHIIGVIEAEKNDSYSTYYLLKNGNKIAKDSVYFFDNKQDCESEGFIRFQDPISKKIGFLNATGQIIIDAEYNWVSSFRNGWSFAIKNAVKHCLDHQSSHSENNCEHWTWQGGDSLLINQKNEVLVRQVANINELDVYHFTEISKKGMDTNLIYLNSEHSTFYAFENYVKVFKKWLNDVSAHSDHHSFYFDEITLWDRKSEQWIKMPSRAFAASKGEQVQVLLSEVQRDDYSYFITRDGLNPFIYHEKNYEKYFNHCGDPLEYQYPVMSVIINKTNENGELFQDHLNFLRTDEGYRLISVSILK